VAKDLPNVVHKEKLNMPTLKEINDRYAIADSIGDKILLKFAGSRLSTLGVAAILTLAAIGSVTVLRWIL
jgi:hypothetical protein